MAAEEIADLLDQLSPDSRRRQDQFSADIQECHQVVFNPESTRLEIEVSLRKWLKKNQPCLFGRLAASEDRISFCVLKESDMERGDAYVQEGDPARTPNLAGRRARWPKAWVHRCYHLGKGFAV